MPAFVLAFAAVALVASALISGRSGGVPAALTELTLVIALGTGVLLGLGLRRFWRGDGMSALMGSGGRYVLFMGLVAFAAVEAHAAGSGLAQGAPAASLAILGAPVILAAVALVSAVRALSGHEDPKNTNLKERQ